MKKKLLVSILVIAISLSAIAGGTLAWFTDAQAIPTNTLKAGVLSLDVKDDFPYEDNTFDNAEPGTSVDKDVSITNDGTKREFLRADITETLTYVLHNDATNLVRYLQDETADGAADLYAGKMVGLNWEVAVDALGNPVLFTGQVGYTAVYITALGAYDPTAWAGDNNITAPTYAPAVQEVTAAALPASVLYTATRDLTVSGQTYTVTDKTPNDATIAQYDWYIDATNLFANSLWTKGTDGLYYYNKILFPGDVAPFLDHVTFASGANDNLLQGTIYTIDSNFQTIQVTNGAVADLSGWNVPAPTVVLPNTFETPGATLTW